MYKIRIPIGLAFLGLVGLFSYIDLHTKTCYATGTIIMILISCALWELYQMLPNRNFFPYQRVATIASFVGIFLYILTFEFSLQGSHAVEFYEAMVLVLLLMYPVCKPNEENILENIWVTLFGLVYIYFTLRYLMKIRLLGKESGLVYLLLLILVSKGMDMGGYLIGKLFGKHKLCPAISPKKSWEGALAGLAFSIGIAFILWRSFEILQHTFITWHTLVMFAISVGFLSLWGDLAESLVKRRCQVKDSSQLIPEFGGILDLMDSLTFTAPWGYYFLVFLGAA